MTSIADGVKSSPSGSLGGRMDALDSLQQRVHDFRPAFHSWGLQHEFGQGPHDMGVERPFLVGYQIVEDVLRVDADGERRDLRIDHSSAQARCRQGVADRPVRHETTAITENLVQLVFQSPA